MSVGTLTNKVDFGIKAKAETKNISNSTSYRVIKHNSFGITKESTIKIQKGYQLINFSDQKKRETFRKLNKMMGGY